MFYVQTAELQPWNCPYCLYAPVSFRDLQCHLDNYHPHTHFLLCPEPLCGFVYALDKDLRTHFSLVHTAVPPKHTLELPKRLKSLIRFTEKYFSAVQRLRETEDFALSSCDDTVLIALMTHAVAAASQFTPSAARKKRNPVALVKSEDRLKNDLKLGSNREQKMRNLLLSVPRDRLYVFETEYSVGPPKGYID